MLTSHQLMWVDSSASSLPGRSCSIPLDAVQDAVLHSPLLWAAPKLCMRMRTDAAGQPMHSGTYNEQVSKHHTHRRGRCACRRMVDTCYLLGAQITVTCRGSITQLHGQLSRAIAAGMARGDAVAGGQRPSTAEVSQPRSCACVTCQLHALDRFSRAVVRGSRQPRERPASRPCRSPWARMHAQAWWRSCNPWGLPVRERCAPFRPRKTLVTRPMPAGAVAS